MPYTRIALNKGKPAAYLAAISHALDRALVEEFDAPEGDLFQLFEQKDKGELVFDRRYLGGPRTDDFVLFAVTTGKPRSRAQKQAFFARLVELLGADPGIRREDVMITVTNTPSENWSFSDGNMWMPAVGPGAAGNALPAQMTVHRVGEGIERMPADVASAPFWAEMLLSSGVDGENNAMRVNMDPGVRTNWHTHPKGQLLYVLSGVGLVQREGADAIEVRAGDSVWFGPGEKHWHGASPASPFSYVSVQAAENGAMVSWLEPVGT